MFAQLLLHVTQVSLLSLCFGVDSELDEGLLLPEPMFKQIFKNMTKFQNLKDLSINILAAMEINQLQSDMIFKHLQCLILSKRDQLESLKIRLGKHYETQDKGIIELVDSFKNLPNLKKFVLQLYKVKIPYTSIMDVIRDKKYLNDLDLQLILISTKGKGYYDLVEYISKIQTLENLYLLFFSCDIEDYYIQKSQALFKQFKNLKKLSLFLEFDNRQTMIEEYNVVFDYPEEQDQNKYENITLSDNDWRIILSKNIENVQDVFLQGYQSFYEQGDDEEEEEYEEYEEEY